MKITKSQLKKMIEEATFAEMSDSQLVAQNRLDINDLYSEIRRVRGELEDSIEELTAKFLDYVSTGEKPSRFAPDVIPGKARLSTDTNPGGMPEMEGLKLTKQQLKQIIKEELKKLSISDIDEALSVKEEELMSIASQAAQYIKDELGLRPGEEENFIEYLSTVMKSTETDREGPGI